MMTFVQRTSEGPSQPDMIGLPVFQVSYVCGPNFSQPQSDSGFSPDTLVFFPHQNRLSVNYIRLRADTLEGDNPWYRSLSLN